MYMRLTCIALLTILPVTAAAADDDPNIDKEAAKKLEIAFGKDFKPVRDAKIKFMVGNHVFACDTFEVEKDGQVKITPGYLAIFEDAEEGKERKRLGNKWVAPSIQIEMVPAVKSVKDMARARIKSFEMPRARVEDFGKP